MRVMGPRYAAPFFRSRKELNRVAQNVPKGQLYSPTVETKAQPRRLVVHLTVRGLTDRLREEGNRLGSRGSSLDDGILGLAPAIA